MASTLAAIVENTANVDFASEFVYDDTKGTFVVPNDMVNAAAVLDAAIIQSQVLPPAVGQTIQIAATDLKGQAEQLALADLTDPDLQSLALQVATAGVGLVISLDFFNENYPDQEAFLDQTIGTGNGVSSEPMPTAAPGTTNSSVPPSTADTPTPVPIVDGTISPTPVLSNGTTESPTLVPTPGSNLTDPPTTAPTTPTGPDSSGSPPSESSSAAQLSAFLFVVTMAVGSVMMIS